MKGLKTMLFGLALICFSGFLVVGQAVGFPFLSPLYWVMLLGLAICFVGLAMNDPDDADGTASGSSEGRGGGDDRGDGDGGNDENEENGDGTDDSGEGDSFEPDHYSPNRFPPM